MMLSWQMEGLFIATLTTFRLELCQQFHPSLRNYRYLCLYRDLFQRYLFLTALSLSIPRLISADHPVPEGHLTVTLSLN